MQVCFSRHSPHAVISFGLRFRRSQNGSMPQIVLENLSRQFRTPALVRAVDSVSLSVANGELLVLAGPSGCGKTTTLRLLAGFETSDQGTISIAGKVVNDLAPAKRDIAMVFQNGALYPHMTARENIGLGLRIRNLPRAEAERRISNISAMLDLGEWLDRSVTALSGGQRQ